MDMISTARHEAACKAWASRRANGWTASQARRSARPMPACMTICGKARVSADHLSTTSHRARTYRHHVSGFLPRERAAWMIALSADPDDQYASRWPDYAPVGLAPLLANAEAAR